MEDVENFRQWESRTPGHPEHFLTPGVETTMGSLGRLLETLLRVRTLPDALGKHAWECGPRDAPGARRRVPVPGMTRGGQAPRSLPKAEGRRPRRAARKRGDLSPSPSATRAALSRARVCYPSFYGDRPRCRLARWAVETVPLADTRR